MERFMLKFPITVQTSRAAIVSYAKSVAIKTFWTRNKSAQKVTFLLLAKPADMKVSPYSAWESHKERFTQKESKPTFHPHFFRPKVQHEKLTAVTTTCWNGNFW